MASTKRLRIGQRVVVNSNARNLTGPVLGWTPEMEELIFHLGKVKAIDGLGRLITVTFPSGDFNFTIDSVSIYTPSSYKLYRAHNRLREKFNILSSWHDARIKGASDWEIGVRENPFTELALKEAWKYGWKERNNKANLELSKVLLLFLFRERQLTAVLATAIERNHWECEDLVPYSKIIHEYIPFYISKD